MKELGGNVLILQMGKASAVTNVVLAALIKKALNYDCIGEIYGCAGGVQGLLNNQLVDLASQPQKNIANLVGTPGAALKSYNVGNFDAVKMMESLRRQNIRYFFVMGDHSAIEYCRSVDEAAKKTGYEMRIVVIPMASDNGIQLTDHCLGYGSMAKHLAVIAKTVLACVQSSQPNGVITILEIGKCDNEWLLSALALTRGRRDSLDAPHIVVLSKFEEGAFVKNVHQTLRNVGNCVVVVGEKLTNLKGEKFVTQRRAAEHMEFIAKANFDVQVDLITLGDWELTSPMTLSGTDVCEAELCAQKAVELAVTVGISGKMITILRADGSKYSSEVGCVDLGNVSSGRKEFPEAWYSQDAMFPDISFFKYSLPLITGEARCAYENGIPSFPQLK
ncbi:MAG: 6-phosphofructokinase [Puniceicoccales bacterium]|jgi:6-phosphofructokinase 1|nr:6-phosphofructokinase [Puniceicoccales bacterium]